MRKPEAIHKHVICSVCGLDWSDHLNVTEIMGQKMTGPPTLEHCVALLRNELDSKNRWHIPAITSSGSFGPLTTSWNQTTN